MGQKLSISSEDSLLQIEDLKCDGLFVGCCCCGQQSLLYFDEVEDLPLNKMEGQYFYIYVCEECKKDIKMLADKGVDKVSYDILWLIQRDLEDALVVVEEKGIILREEREEILLNLYKNLETKIKDASSEILK